jgi:arginine-tRNA-protein transferase
MAMKQEGRDKLRNHQFFITPSHPCSYLAAREATTLFLDPREAVSEDLYSDLTDLGFRRSGAHLYRPHCESCSACVPVRIPVQDFSARRRHRRVNKRNADLKVRIEPASLQPKYFSLYERYISARHRDGDMFPANADQFRSFLLSPWARTEFLCLYLGPRLISVGAIDRQKNGFSAIYTFFDPELDDRSLGVYSVLQQIELCKRRTSPYLYLGYWVKDCQKMSYKTDYRPLELLVNDRWVTLR